MLSHTGLTDCKRRHAHLHPPPAAVDGVLRRLKDLRHVVRRPLVALLQRQLVDAAAELVRDLRRHNVASGFILWGVIQPVHNQHEQQLVQLKQITSQLGNVRQSRAGRCITTDNRLTGAL